MGRSGLLLGMLLAAAVGSAQDRKTAALQKKLERALQEVNPRDAKAAVERLAELGGAEAAQTLAEALSAAVYRIDNFRRSHYAYFD